MIPSAIVSFHLNPFTCGVARFNHSLADALGVRVISLAGYLESPSSDPVLLSIKLEELTEAAREELMAVLMKHRPTYDYFLHAVSDSDLERALCVGARRLFAGSSEMAANVSRIRGDALSVFAPGAPVLPQSSAVDCSLLTFGMAHKIRSEEYRRLGAMLQLDTRSFRLEISTALHEGNTFDSSFFTVGKEISDAFSGNVRFLGFLSDSEVSERLRQVDALVAFFPRGVRENNTTVLSAMTHGCPIVTNLDEFSPRWMRHGETVFDVQQLTEFPAYAELRRVGAAGLHVASEFSFDRLARIISQS